MEQGIEAFLQGDWQPPQFLPRPLHFIECPTCHVETDADPSMVHRWERVGENLLVFVLECPACEEVGVLSLTSGPGAPDEAGAVTKELLRDH